MKPFCAYVAAALAAILFLSLGGCPTDASSNKPVVSSVQAAARETADAGSSVLLAAVVEGEGDLTQIQYQWFQTSGRAVTLTNANKQIASFSAPSLASSATIGFRVDVTAGTKITSAATSLIINADPNFGTDGTPNSDTDDDPRPQVKLTTDKGTIVVELNRDAAPISVRNFLQYVDSGFYNQTIFHRVIPDFVVQGGGFSTGLVQKDARAPIVNESTNGLLNERGTIAMARTNDPNSATSQFFFNLINNTSLDRTETFPGYAVFGRVIVGMDIVDDIAAVETSSQSGMDDVPVDEVFLQKAERVSGVTPVP